LNFLEARRLLDGFGGGPALPFLFAISGSAEPFDLYLRAAGAKQGRTAVPRVLPFNTLAQNLRAPKEPDAVEVFLLLPWDFVPEADWRLGAPSHADEASMRTAAHEIEQLLAQRGSSVLYVPAPMPPLFADHRRDQAFALELESIAAGLGAQVLPREAFSLSGYFNSGCPVGGAWIGRVASAVVDAATRAPSQPKKVLVTDLDNVMWHGGIGEDGLHGISYEQHGRGFPHFVYQGLLRRLRAEGTVLAAVSRNDSELALAPFRAGGMTLKEDDFIAIVASYHAKSAQITELATALNMGLSDFVFVDDNPIELNEVSAALPAVTCVAFPSQADGLSGFFAELATLFTRRSVTAEDRERTSMYRRRLEGLAPSALAGADISEFLRGLGMTLTLHDRTHGDRTRAVQLVNKTNQFNLNGRRVTDQQVAAVIAAGGRLHTASVSDRNGSHGEILSCLVTGEGVITSLVLSCRVFQRRIEHGFLAWLAAQHGGPLSMAWERTPRNEPFAQFLEEVAGQPAPPDGTVSVDAADIEARCAGALALFEVVTADAAAQ
jgi:FkbH-like protein